MLKPHLEALTDKQKAEAGLELLVQARELFKAAGNKQTTKRVQLAISSARGAVRIQEYRATREDIIKRPWGDE